MQEHLWGMAYESFRYERVALGVGAGLLWASLIQYFQYTAGLYLVARILKIVGPVFFSVRAAACVCLREVVSLCVEL